MSQKKCGLAANSDMEFFAFVCWFLHSFIVSLVDTQTETSGNGGDCTFQCLSLDSTCTALIVLKGALLLS